MKIIIPFLIILFPFWGMAGNYDKILVGEHLISLQWISWHNFGKAKITRTAINGVYKITGIQENKDKSKYLKIDGTLKPVSEKRLIFNGSIETRTGLEKQGSPCLREGSYNFRVTGKRKYWRLKEMYNPCRNDSLIDYIDIYLKF